MSAISPLLRLRAVVAAVLAVVVAAVVLTWLLSGSDEPGWSGNGITLNTNSWEPGDDGDDMGIRGTVRVDSDGCVYLEGTRPVAVSNVQWPKGYTASRQSDGAVTISNPDGEVVAASGHRLSAGGSTAPSAELACRAEGTKYGTVTIQGELPPLND
ncbi:MAG TPA: hypothetical protein VEX15_22015 [Nocardioidaceae bacterium]|nr:hypothetical protein [Nocardioidaceae bacterium]